MAKMIHICFRNPEAKNLTRADLEKLGGRLCPDNITPKPALIRESDTTLMAVFNPNPAIETRDDSVCLGNLIAGAGDWWIPKADIPDGSFVITRMNSDYVESLSDAVGTRALWFVHTENLFMASTSQRAIIYCLRSLEINREAVSWLISAGNTGPGIAWDQRIKFLGGHARVLLDRATWKVTVNREDLHFAPVRASRKEHMQRLRTAHEASVRAVELDFTKWLFLLSGGYDSRSIYMVMHDRKNLKAITWGTRAAMEDEQSDARIAVRLAEAFNVPHTYLSTEITSPDSVEQMLARYLAQGEGRIDRFEGYTDGFKIWKDLYESGIWGVVRGDPVFGGKPVYDAIEVRDSIGMSLLTDFSNIPPAVVAGLGRQSVPDHLQQREGESLATWRDRLYLDVFVGSGLSANADLKFGYIEIVNPLVSRAIVDVVLTEPDSMRTDKILFKEMVTSMFPEMPFASRVAVGSHKNLVRSAPFVKLIKEELSSPHAASIFGQEFVDWILPKIKPAESSDGTLPPSLQSRIRQMLPVWLKHLIRRMLGHKVSQRALEPNLLAFRAFMASRTIRMLQEDAQAMAKR